MRLLQQAAGSDHEIWHNEDCDVGSRPITQRADLSIFSGFVDPHHYRSESQFNRPQLRDNFISPVSRQSARMEQGRRNCTIPQTSGEICQERHDIHGIGDRWLTIRRVGLGKIQNELRVNFAAINDFKGHIVLIALDPSY